MTKGAGEPSPCENCMWIGCSSNCDCKCHRDLPKVAAQPETEERADSDEEWLMNYLGVSWMRQNSALTVHIYEPEFKVESLLPSDKNYRAHFALGDAWKKLVKLAGRARSVSSPQTPPQTILDWTGWRQQLLDAWAHDHRATMTALLEDGPERASHPSSPEPNR